jgi:hypothetical protein
MISLLAGKVVKLISRSPSHSHKQTEWWLNNYNESWRVDCHNHFICERIINLLRDFHVSKQSFSCSSCDSFIVSTMSQCKINSKCNKTVTWSIRTLEKQDRSLANPLTHPFTRLPVHLLIPRIIPGVFNSEAVYLPWKSNPSLLHILGWRFCVITQMWWGVPRLTTLYQESVCFNEWLCYYVISS